MKSVYEFFRQFRKPTKEELKNGLYKLAFKLYRERNEERKNGK